MRGIGIGYHLLLWAAQTLSCVNEVHTNPHTIAKRAWAGAIYGMEVAGVSRSAAQCTVFLSRAHCTLIVPTWPAFWGVSRCGSSGPPSHDRKGPMRRALTLRNNLFPMTSSLPFFSPSLCPSLPQTHLGFLHPQDGSRPRSIHRHIRPRLFGHIHRHRLVAAFQWSPLEGRGWSEAGRLGDQV